jgi:hypothetical protein
MLSNAIKEKFNIDDPIDESFKKRKKAGGIEAVVENFDFE